MNKAARSRRRRLNVLRLDRADKLSKKTLLRLVAVVRDSNDAVIIRDLKDRIISWNKGAQNMYGYTVAEALGMSLRRLIPANARIQPESSPGLEAAPIQIQRRAKNGRMLDVQLTVTVLRDELGRPVEIATTERDVTQMLLDDRELRRLHARVISAQETERKRLARELHDGIGQILSGVKYRLQSLPTKMRLRGGSEAKLHKIGEFLDHAISEIRRVSRNLMPSELEDLGLESALLALCREFKENAGILLTVRTEPVVVGSEQALALFRIAQEALNNIGKHSRATHAVVELATKGNAVSLSVSDNGIGFKLGDGRLSSSRGIGLGNMRQRAESVGGSLEVHAPPGKGTTLRVLAPLSGRSEAAF